MTEQRSTRPHRVVIGGGGVAALEALLALHDLASEHVDVTLVAPSDEFVVRALSVAAPFGGGAAPPHDVERLCTEHGARFRRDALHLVQPERGSVVTRRGDVLGYDSLLLAVGARPVAPFPGVLAFRGPVDADAMHAVVGGVERGELQRVAFVVPAGVTWALPLYELALRTAERAADRGRDVRLTIVTPESTPMAALGAAASEQVAALLDDRGVVVRAGCHVRRISGDTVLASPGDVWVDADRIVTVPVLHGPSMAGVPRDAHGFLPVDDHGRVPGVDGVFGAGDGTTTTIKQGGVAAQLAGAVARAIARRAGADVEPERFRPRLRARLVTGRTELTLGDGPPLAGKLAAPYLTPYLESLEAAAPR